LSYEKRKESKRKKRKTAQPNEIPIVPIDCPEPAQIEKESPKKFQGVFSPSTRHAF
jgi:hypothetical protein